MSPVGEAANDRLGLAFAVIGPSGLGLAVALSRYAYQGGTNGLTLASARGVLMLGLLLVICWLSGRRMTLPPRYWLQSVGLGFLLAMMAYGNVGSVEFISVGLAALLFFTFPPIVAVMHAVVLRERMANVKGLAVVVAFVGLALMLGVSFGASDWRGIVLALGAAAATAWNAVWLSRRLSHCDSLVVTLHMAAVAATVLVALTLVSGQWRWPTTAGGWFGTVAVAVLQASSLPLYFAAISRIGSLKTTLISNVQPLVSIVAAFVLFGERLTPLQFAGGSCVLGGIWLMQWHDARSSRAARIG